MDQLFKRDGKWMTIEKLREYEKKNNEEVQMEESTIKVEEPSVEDVTDESKPAFICAFCGRECKSQWHLDMHLKSHKDEQPSETVFEPEETIDTEPIAPEEEPKLEDSFTTKPISEEPAYTLNEDLDKILE